MFGKPKNEKLSYGIVGLGRFGMALANELASAGADILVIDSDEEKVRLLREQTDNALVVHSLDKATLAETGIQNCDVAVVCIGEQLEPSILTTLNLVDMGVKKVIAKATSAEHGEILRRLGAEVVYPERDMAVRLAKRLESSRVLDFIQLSAKINITKFAVPDKMVGHSVAETNLRAQFGLNIIAIVNGPDVLESVHPDYVFRAGDCMFVSGSEASVNKLSDWIGD